MAGSINKVILLGRLGADPEIRVSQDGKKIARFSLATSESWKDKNTSEKKEKTEWHKVVIFSVGLAEIVEKYIKKGSLIYIEGQINTRSRTRLCPRQVEGIPCASGAKAPHFLLGLGDHEGRLVR